MWATMMSSVTFQSGGSLTGPCHSQESPSSTASDVCVPVLHKAVACYVILRASVMTIAQGSEGSELRGPRQGVQLGHTIRSVRFHSPRGHHIRTVGDCRHIGHSCHYSQEPRTDKAQPALRWGALGVGLSLGCLGWASGRQSGKVPRAE